MWNNPPILVTLIPGSTDIHPARYLTCGIGRSYLRPKKYTSASNGGAASVITVQANTGVEVSITKNAFEDKLTQNADFT